MAGKVGERMLPASCMRALVFLNHTMHLQRGAPCRLGVLRCMLRRLPLAEQLAWRLDG